MRATLVLLAAFALAGCGAAKLGTPSAEVVTASLDGKPAARLGFGAEGGEKPALLERRAGGWVLVFAGTRSGDRHLYMSTSADGQRWSRPKQVLAGEFSDQAPALAEDAAGKLHLYFASNRAGDMPAAYHAAEPFTTAEALPGFEGAQDLAAAGSSAGVTLVAEVMGAGVLAATSADGARFGAPSTVVAAGAEPAAATLADGRTLVAWQAEGKIMAAAGKPGAWGAPVVAATGDGRLRDPALAVSGDQGLLIYSEKLADGFGLKARGFGSGLKFEDAEAPVTGPGDARGAAIVLDDNGSITLAWGMKTTNGQQGVIVTTR